MHTTFGYVSLEAEHFNDALFGIGTEFSSFSIDHFNLMNEGGIEHKEPYWMVELDQTIATLFVWGFRRIRVKSMLSTLAQKYFSYFRLFDQPFVAIY